MRPSSLLSRAALPRRTLLATLAASAALGPARAQGRVRVVVVGGGWGGLSAARHVQAALPTAEITLVEPNRAFMSCPLSIHYLVGERSAETLTFPLDGLARRGIRHLPERAGTIDRSARLVVTQTERVAYDWTPPETPISVCADCGTVPGEPAGRQDWCDHTGVGCPVRR